MWNQGQTVNYSYDAVGRRSAITTNGATTNFIYDGADVIEDKQGASQTNYLNGGFDRHSGQCGGMAAIYCVRRKRCLEHFDPLRLHGARERRGHKFNLLSSASV